MLRELQGTGQLGLRGKGKELMDSVAEDVQALASVRAGICRTRTGGVGRYNHGRGSPIYGWMEEGKEECSQSPVEE